MSDLIEHCHARVSFVANPAHTDLEASDAEARRVAREHVPAWNS